MMNKEQIMITCWITQVETFIYILYDIKISVRMVFEGYWSRFILIYYNHNDMKGSVQERPK